MNAKQRELKERLLVQRGGVCEHCYARQATDLHHCLIRRDKRFPQLNTEENYMIVCHECHMSGIVDAKVVRDKFWKTQCRRYGAEHMQDWLDNLPMKVKPIFHA